MSSNTSFGVFSPGPNTTTTTTTGRRSSSTVRSRPRHRRMVSLPDDECDPSPLNLSERPNPLSPDLAAHSHGLSPSPHPSRGVSPIPMRHPSRATERGQNGENAGLGGLYTGQTRGKATGSSRSAADLLDASWSSLQSLASSVLGSDIARTTTNGSASPHARKPSRPDYIRDLSRGPASSKWGPSGPPTPEIGAGAKEERHALVQAKKREVLLLADTDLATARSRHKRRDSCDRSGIDPEQDGGALAYVHHVQPADTMTGVTIRYGCQQAVLRKANGFWPTDSIQGRKTVLLPVESCSVKGRPIRPEVDLLGDPNEWTEDPNDSSIVPAPAETGTPSADANQTSEPEVDRIWKHESWVQIDGFAAPVEIGRVPRRTLGFFPRTRRKSMCYTDEPAAQGRSPRPSSSVDPEPTESRESRSLSQSRELPGGNNSAHPARHQRQRSGIQLSGPGVGTLDRKSMAPGPALDALSKFFAQHLPTFAPETPAPSFESLSTVPSNTPSMGLDNIGGAVEGWVRKMTTKARNSYNELQGSPSQLNVRDVQTSSRRMGDLIELDDARSSPDILAERTRAELCRSTASLQESPSLRPRFPSPGITSGTRKAGTGYDRGKDD